MSARFAPRGGVFRRAGFQAQNVLPAFAIHTYRTVSRYPTMSQSAISGSREAGNGRSAKISMVSQRFSRVVS